MVARNLGGVTYVPILSVRPAEVRALEELPSADKDRLFPLFQLRPWASALTLDSALKKIEDAYAKRPLIVDLCEPELVVNPRPVHEELSLLRTPDDGYANWCAFIETRENYVPAVRLGRPDQLIAQVGRLHALEKGMVVPIQRLGFTGLSNIARGVAVASDGGTDVLFVLDYGRATRELLTRQAEAAGLIRSILTEAPNASIALSASSFPDGFVDLQEQDIYERALFNGVSAQFPNTRLIYSDRGSARAERQTGGGGAPAPRIDYARQGDWLFYRADQDPADRVAAYIEQATMLVEDEDIWDSDLRVWGCQMIERTAAGDTSAIVSPARSTAARINIHLHRQLFYGDEDGLYETDEDWVD